MATLPLNRRNPHKGLADAVQYSAWELGEVVLEGTARLRTHSSGIKRCETLLSDSYDCCQMETNDP